ncbi:hypothetical protein C8N43_2799 [Litoreibacter ponti]|uniref:Inner membrane protein n=1 Tax=Litoreibacter ponti TaxID=1510457 RepID=A0A2T6BPV7_9RHOB|nr:hypothetical protein [Litoreibacter ponti]PTX58123.1 hypothetical protein C8N43_2799 [Litoreibacter ponti]
MARKKKTPSDADPKPETPASDADAPSKAGAISGAVKGADFDTPDAAMADTSLEPKANPEDDTSSEAPKDGASDDTPEDAIILSDKPATDDTRDDTEDATSEPESSADVEVMDADAPTVAPLPAAPPPPPPAQKSGFFGTLLGGILAAIIGFGGAIYFEAAEWPVFGGNQQDELQALVSEQSSQLEGVSETLASLNAQFEAAQTQNAAALAELETRLDEMPAFGGPEVLPEELQATLAAQKAEMEALQENLNEMAALAEQQIASAQAEQENAAAAEARAQARGAMNQLRTALNSGAAYSDVLPDIEAATDVPDALASQAESGVPTAADLEASFSASARAALSASLKATAGDAPADRLTLFLKDQLGARSLTPREGDDPDAVLSRAEADLKAGNLDAALETVSALPEAGQTALEDWAQQARTRNAALAAFDTLSDALSGK